MTMGNVMSRLARMLRRKKVSPSQVPLLQRNVINHEIPDNQLTEKTKSETKQSLKYISTIKDASVEQCGEVSNVLDRSKFGDCSQPIRIDEVKGTDNRAVENHCTEGVNDSKQRTEVTVSFNETKCAQKETFCLNDIEKETLCPTADCVQDSEDLHSILESERGISTENTTNKRTSPGVSYNSGKECGDWPSPVTDGPDGKFDSLSWISKDGYSTEGTVGSGEGSFGERDDEIIDRLLVDNSDDVVIDDKNFDTDETGLSSARKSALTPLSLETLNSSEIDKRECVRSYIQAWSPLNLPTVGTTSYLDSLPGACADVGAQRKPASESYEIFPSIYDDDNQITTSEPQELHELDSQEFCLFYQRSSEPVSKPLSDSWNLLKNDRAPWLGAASAGSNEVIQGRGWFTGDEEGSGWLDQNNRLTLSSLSTINEESDDALTQTELTIYAKT